MIPRRPGVRQRAGLLERRVGQGRLWCRRVTGLLTCPAPWLPKAAHGEQLESSPRFLSSTPPTSSSSSAGARERVDGTPPITPLESQCASIAEARPTLAATPVDHFNHCTLAYMHDMLDEPMTDDLDLLTVMFDVVVGACCSSATSSAQCWSRSTADGGIARGGLADRDGPG